MTQHPGNPAGLSDPHELDLFEFARSGRQAAGVVRVSQLPRMLNEVPAEAPDRDTAFTWQAEGSTQPELQDDGTEASAALFEDRGSRRRMARMSAVHDAVFAGIQRRCNLPDRQH